MKKLITTTLLLSSASAFAAVPHTFIAGEKALASEVNENFTSLDDRITALESGGASSSGIAYNYIGQPASGVSYNYGYDFVMTPGGFEEFQDGVNITSCTYERRFLIELPSGDHWEFPDTSTGVGFGTPVGDPLVTGGVAGVTAWSAQNPGFCWEVYSYYVDYEDNLKYRYQSQSYKLPDGVNQLTITAPAQYSGDILYVVKTFPEVAHDAKTIFSTSINSLPVTIVESSEYRSDKCGGAYVSTFAMQVETDGFKRTMPELHYQAVGLDVDECDRSSQINAIDTFIDHITVVIEPII